MSDPHRFIPETPVDHVARETIANWIDQTLFVEAAAGTGKTTSMVERMLTLIRCGVSVSHIAAITFTRKAAAELRGRFYQRLQQAASEALDDVEADRFASAIDELDRCTIGTIHSFCSGLLRQRPFEAGVGMNFTELDADAEDLLLERAWDDFVSECIADGTYAEQMVALGMRFEQLAPSFKTFCGYADVDHWPAGEASDDEIDLDSLHRDVEACAGHMQSLWPMIQNRDVGTDKLIPLYLQFPRTVRAKKLLPPGELLDYLCNLRAKPKNTQKNWGEDKASKELGKSEAGYWESFHNRVIAPIIPVFRSKRYALVMEIFHQARMVYSERRRRRGMLSFQDLLLKAATMLRDHETVRRHFVEQIQYLLIDEFQDTDPIQAEIMMLLTSDDLSESDWTRCRPRPGALFVVGDPKQSIYRFRRADIGIYQMVRQQVLDSGGHAVSLTTNFRSSQSVVDWVNGIFGKDDPDFFGREATDLQAAATEMHAGRDAPSLADAATINGVYRLELGSEKVSDLLTEDADRIARFIRNAIDSGATILDFDRDGAEVVARPRPVRPGDFMILTYRLKHLSTYAEALVRAGLAAQVTGGGQLNETVEIDWLCRALGAIADPMNPIALVAYLRSELMGFSDDDLHRFKLAGGVFDYRCDIPDMFCETEPDLARAFADATNRLRRYARWVDEQFPPVVVVEKMLDDLGLLLHAASGDDADARVGAMGRLVELLREQQRVDFNASDLLELLRKIVAEEVTFDVIPPRPYSQPPVRVMNLHKAKGLEAPIVFLASPVGGKPKQSRVHVDREDGAPRGFMTCEHTVGRNTRTVAFPSNWEEKKAIENAFQDAETARLLYVAATRAGRSLIVSTKAARRSASVWAAFDPSLAEVPSLDTIVFEPSDVAHPAESGDVVPIDPVSERLEAISKPTYAERSAKTFALANGEIVKTTTAGLGQAWGSAVHHILEQLMRRPDADVELVAREAVEQYGVTLLEGRGQSTEQLVAELVSVGRGVTRSEVWTRAQESLEVLVEVPYVRSVDGEDVATLERGVIDLAFREADGWVLVDYKTDAAARDNAEGAVEHYRPQLATYAEAWTQLTDQSVAETGIYFVATDAYHVC